MCTFMQDPVLSLKYLLLEEKVLSEENKLQNPAACHRTHLEGVCSQTDYGDRDGKMNQYSK